MDVRWNLLGYGHSNGNEYTIRSDGEVIYTGYDQTPDIQVTGTVWDSRLYVYVFEIMITSSLTDLIQDVGGNFDLIVGFVSDRRAQILTPGDKWTAISRMFVDISYISGHDLISCDDGESVGHLVDSYVAQNLSVKVKLQNWPKRRSLQLRLRMATDEKTLPNIYFLLSLIVLYPVKYDHGPERVPVGAE